jgi:hypothetical protein
MFRGMRATRVGGRRRGLRISISTRVPVVLYCYVEITCEKERPWAQRVSAPVKTRYESIDPDVVDGALFAFVTSAGTDPEALLVIEARHPSRTDGPSWHYAVTRFTDLQLWVRHKDKEVLGAPSIVYDAPIQDPNPTFAGKN